MGGKKQERCPDVYPGGAPKGMIVSLGLSAPREQKDLFFSIQFLRLRAFRAIASLLPVNTYETLAIITKEESLCLPGAARVWRAARADTRLFKGVYSLHLFFCGILETSTWVHQTGPGEKLCPIVR
jgi:hypothetical protein